MNNEKKADIITMPDDDILETGLDIRNQCIGQDRSKKEKNTVHRGAMLRKWSTIAACLCLCAVIACGAIFLPKMLRESPPSLPPKPSGLPQKQMDAVLSQATGKLQSVASTYDLAPMTEEALFHDPRLCAVRGEITEIKNYRVAPKNGGMDTYFSVIHVKVEKVYKGTFRVGDVIRIYTYVPIGQGDIWYEDSGTISKARVGQKAIFTPYLYDTEYVYSDGKGGSISLLDISDCRLGDGERFAFIDTGKGLAFFRIEYIGATNARTLDDIEAYVVKQLK